CSVTKSIEVSVVPNSIPEGEVEQSLSEGQILADLEVEGENLTWYIDEELTTEIPDTTQIAFDTFYYVTQTIDGCESEALKITVRDALHGSCDYYTIRNGTDWSNGITNQDKGAIIEGDLTLTEDLTACELLLNSGILTVNSGVTLTVKGVIENTQSATNFIVENGANLIQTDDVDNIGAITVYKNSSDIKHLDYTIWSSPVEGQGLKAFSPQTLWYRIYTYTPAADPANDQWSQVFDT